LIKGSYDIVDGFGLTLQSLTPGIGHPNAKHLNGSLAYGNDVLEAGVGTFGTVIPSGLGARSLGLLRWAKPIIGKAITQVLGRAASSKILGQNLLASGITRPLNSAAHHIVAGGDNRAKVARAILKRAGIDINDASNGVFLPKNSKFVNGTAPAHSKIHTDKYYSELTKRLQSATDVLSELQNIGDEILKGIFPY
jgi:hypothetical protein